MKNKFEKIVSVATAILLWQLLAVIISEKVLLVSPLDVIVRLSELILQSSFWNSVIFSFKRITIGFITAVVTGTILAVLSYRYKILEIFLWPYMSVIKSTPVASFIILCLIWLTSSDLPIFISFIIVVPVVYSNMLTGFKNTDKKMLEMAEVFNLSFKKKLLYIYLPTVKPYFISACTISIGLAWKSGIAAEIIGIPSGSIGEMLYNAKLYLATSDLFSWTVTVIIASILFEKFILFLLNKLFYRLENL